MLISKIIIYFIIATIPLLFAAVQPWVWSVYSVLIFTAFLVLFWKDQNRRSRMPDRAVIFTVVAFFLVTIWHYLPLPASVLSFLSPFRQDALATLNNLLTTSTSWQTLSYSPLNSFSWWTFLLSAFLFFFVLRHACESRKSLKLLIGIMVGLAIAEAIYGLIQALIPSLGVLWVDYIKNYLGTARGTFINRNHFAGFIEMVWPLALGYTLAMGFRGKEVNIRKLLASDRLNKQILLALGIVVMLLALLLSKSRAGIMGAFIGFFTFILLARSADKKLPMGFWIMSGAMAGLIILYGFKIGFDPIIHRFMLIGEGDSRLSIWRDSLVIVKDHPLGIGLGNFKNVYPVYNVSRISDTRFLYAHNDYLHLLIEAGIPGFLALVSGFLFFLLKSVKKVKQMKVHHDPLRFFLAVGAVSGLVSLAFHSFFDFNLHMPSNLVYFVTLMAIVHSCAWSEAPAHGSRLKAEGSKVKKPLKAQSSNLKANNFKENKLKAQS
jgi:O-antigen ligase